VAEHQLDVHEPGQVEIAGEPGRSVDLAPAFLPSQPSTANCHQTDDGTTGESASGAK
jgi:hypothetical protein